LLQINSGSLLLIQISRCLIFSNVTSQWRFRPDIESNFSQMQQMTKPITAFSFFRRICAKFNAKRLDVCKIWFQIFASRQETYE